MGTNARDDASKHHHLGEGGTGAGRDESGIDLGGIGVGIGVGLGFWLGLGCGLGFGLGLRLVLGLKFGFRVGDWVMQRLGRGLG